MVELAILIPILALLFTASVPAVRAVLHHSYLNQLSQSGARYATRGGPDPAAGAGTYSVRRTADEVETWLLDIATEDGQIDPASLVVTVDPEPSTALPNTPVTVTVQAPVALGVFASATNNLLDLFMDDPPFPEGNLVLQSTATMREE